MDAGKQLARSQAIGIKMAAIFHKRTKEGAWRNFTGG